MKKISLFLVVIIVISTLAMFNSCVPDKVAYMTPPTINGLILSILW